MVLWYRGQFGSLDRALRRERLWNRFGSGGPRLQTSQRRARFGVARFSVRRRNRIVVGQAFEYFETLACWTGNRSASADAPNEKAGVLNRSQIGSRRGTLIGLNFEHRFNLLAQFRRLFVSMRGDRMLHRCVKDFLFGTGNFERAILLTRIISAIDRFSLSCHCDLRFN